MARQWVCIDLIKVIENNALESELAKAIIENNRQVVRLEAENARRFNEVQKLNRQIEVLKEKLEAEKAKNVQLRKDRPTAKKYKDAYLELQALKSVLGSVGKG